MDSKSTPNWTAYFLGKTDLFVQIDRPEPLGGKPDHLETKFESQNETEEAGCWGSEGKEKEIKGESRNIFKLFSFGKSSFFPRNAAFWYAGQPIGILFAIRFFRSGGQSLKRSHPIRRLRGFSTPFFLHLTQTQCSPSFARRVCFFARTEPLELDLY